jgi:hypothetical protein
MGLANYKINDRVAPSSVNARKKTPQFKKNNLEQALIMRTLNGLSQSKKNSYKN